MKDITKTFHDISVDQIRVRYLDDETCYVNFEEALMGELIGCARDVPGTRPLCLQKSKPEIKKSKENVLSHEQV